ncbi:MAG: endonuclease [Muribaculaceae bacterium]|nr:endonuclease [Muribaculaceae bacterium]
MKKSISVLCVTAAAAAAMTITAAIPAGYYRSLDGKSGAALKTAACELVYNHTQLNYQALSSHFLKTDVYPVGDPKYGQWWDMYGNIPLYTPSFSGLNREHSFPKSWWGGGTNTPAYTDINHLYPSEAKANQAKSNWPLGEVYSPNQYDNGVSKVGTAVTGQGGGARYVFEPADEYKGDFARTYFYMVTCYQNLTWASSYSWMLQQNTYPTLARWAVELLLKWHREDPVSQKELDRNEAVYLLQSNRNPFIDYPNLAEYIWGNRVGEAFSTAVDPNPGEPNLITPTQGMSLDFGEVAVGSETTARLFFSGQNLTGSFELTISRNDKTMFALSDATIKAEYVNSPEGYWTTITYRPTAVGEHKSMLFVQDGGISGSRRIELRGECKPVPTLSTLTATEATDVTGDSYVANWLPSTDDVVDYYVVTRTHYLNGQSSVEELVAEENSLEINGVEGPESYYVQSVRLGYRSAPSNVIYVEPAGVTQLYAELPFGTAYEPGGVRFVCGANIYNVSIYDMTGREVMLLPEVTDGMSIQLPRGCYIISAPGQRAPFRVIVSD